MWDKIAEVAKDVAPTLASVVGGPAAGGAAKLLTSFFGGDESNPEDILSKMQNDPEMTAKLEKLEKEHEQELRRLAIKAEENRLEHDTQQTAQINQTMRAEYKNDVYWRRAVGWAFALTVVGFPLSVVYLMATSTIDISQLSEVVAAMKEFWYAVLIVLGVGAHHAGKRERTQAGEKGGGMAQLVSAFKGK